MLHVDEDVCLAKPTCGKCTNSVATTLMQCSKFLNWFHMACSDVTEEVYPHIGRIKGCLWFSESCIQLVENDLQQPGVTKPFTDSIKESNDSTVEATIKHVHDKIEQLSSNMS